MSLPGPDPPRVEVTRGIPSLVTAAMCNPSGIRPGVAPRWYILYLPISSSSDRPTCGMRPEPRWVGLQRRTQRLVQFTSVNSEMLRGWNGTLLA